MCAIFRCCFVEISSKVLPALLLNKCLLLRKPPSHLCQLEKCHMLESLFLNKCFFWQAQDRRENATCPRVCFWTNASSDNHKIAEKMPHALDFVSKQMLLLAKAHKIAEIRRTQAEKIFRVIIVHNMLSFVWLLDLTKLCNQNFCLKKRLNHVW